MERLRAHARALSVGNEWNLDPESATLGVIASRWYPADMVHALLDEITRDWQESEKRRVAAEAAGSVMRATLGGVYRTLFRMMITPERYARHAPKLWSFYYDSGVFTVLPQGSGRAAISTVRDWSSHHPFMCGLNRGAAIAIYRAMGCTDVECDRVACVSKGDPECRFITRWSSERGG